MIPHSMYGQTVESWLERICIEGRSFWSNVSLFVVVKCNGILASITTHLTDTL